MADPQSNFYQNPSAGGTPTAFINYIDPTPFEPVIYEHWDYFEHIWQEKGWQSILYAVSIVFNNDIYLCGQGSLPPNMNTGVPQFDTFTHTPELWRIKKQIGEVADRLGIHPVVPGVPGSINPNTPNMVFVTNPRFPKPGQSGLREREGPYSNL